MLECIPERKLKYTHLASISQLPDVPESYSTLDFDLAPDAEGTQTTLSLRVSNFPTESIRGHLEMYWRVTLIKIREYAEANPASL